MINSFNCVWKINRVLMNSTEFFFWAVSRGSIKGKNGKKERKKNLHHNSVPHDPENDLRSNEIKPLTSSQLGLVLLIKTEINKQSRKRSCVNYKKT